MLYAYYDDDNIKHIITLYEQWEIDFIKARFGCVKKLNEKGKEN